MNTTRSAEKSPSRIEFAVLVLTTCVAFSPAATDAVAHWIREPWSLYSLTFVLILPLALRREAPRPGARPVSGLGWIAAGLVVELLAAFVGAMRWARPGLALAAYGLIRRAGLGSWRSAGLVFLAIPAPAFVLRGASTALMEGLLPQVVSLCAALGLAPAELESLRPLIDPRCLLMAHLLAGLAWYEGVLFERSLPRTALSIGIALTGALGAIALALGAAVAASSLGWEPALARGIVRWAWLPVAVVGVGWIEWRYRRDSSGAFRT